MAPDLLYCVNWRITELSDLFQPAKELVSLQQLSGDREMKELSI
jgi:hypothetical protein